MIWSAKNVQVGDRYRYQGNNTPTKDRVYSAGVVGVYRHHIVLMIQPIINPLDRALTFTPITPYRWSVAKQDLGVTDFLN